MSELKITRYDRWSQVSSYILTSPVSRGTQGGAKECRRSYVRGYGSFYCSLAYSFYISALSDGAVSLLYNVPLANWRRRILQKYHAFQNVLVKKWAWPTKPLTDETTKYPPKPRTDFSTRNTKNGERNFVRKFVTSSIVILIVFHCISVSKTKRRFRGFTIATSMGSFVWLRNSISGKS